MTADLPPVVSPDVMLGPALQAADKEGQVSRVSTRLGRPRRPDCPMKERFHFAPAS